MNSSPCVTVVSPGQGKVLHAFGETVRILIDGAASGGVLTQWIEETPPGGGPPPHFHLNEDECFVVLEGSASFYDDATKCWTEAGPGGSAFMPRGSVHAFKNTGTGTLKLLITTTPSGFETFFARCAEVFAQAGPPDMARIIAIGEEHGIHFA
jgi:mannose-6-phosphate isomerase-like protein (cupin superfamily)